MFVSVYTQMYVFVYFPLLMCISFKLNEKVVRSQSVLDMKKNNKNHRKFIQNILKAASELEFNVDRCSTGWNLSLFRNRPKI